MHLQYNLLDNVCIYGESLSLPVCVCPYVSAWGRAGWAGFTSVNQCKPQAERTVRSRLFLDHRCERAESWMTYLIMRCEEVFCLSLRLVLPTLLKVRRATRRHHYPFTGRHTVIQNEGRALALAGVRKGGLLGSWKERQLKTICCKAWFEYSLNFYIVLNVTQMQISIDYIFFWACYVHLFFGLNGKTSTA